ncbi:MULTISPECIES: type II toxin-antitoxin system RelE/ParE family toxin [Parabacteroides]|jgi:putative stabilisation protein|uniref:type II toxin-antitoxin system RelE/ParE family toxin n=1 Tax=Parabacteroides TaxID=375288 RepID=UPI000EFE83B4|nr:MULTISPECIES: type II toxin-antitoxin system RelE/ParE family toxin [Parabacteroides]RKU65577.1 type II toxin-antitoxin system RelE/ParE family toxin [Parabacteroides sp. AF17-3]
MVNARAIIWDEEVLQELEEIADFYDERNGNTRYSSYLLNKFRETIKQAVSFPLSGKATEYPHLRYLIAVPEYSLFYHYSDELITVLVLWDNRRNPERLAYTLRNQDPQYLNEPTVPYEKQTSSTNVKD